MKETADSTGKRLRQTYIDFVTSVRPRIENIWKARKQFLLVNGIVVILALVPLLFILKPYYVSTVDILPDYGANASSSSLSGIASLVTGGTGTPAEIYQALLTSETVTQPVLTKKRKTAAFRDSVTLIDYFRVPSPDPSLPPEIQSRLQFLGAFKKFQNDILTTNIDALTKVLTVSVSLPESKLSADVVNDVVQSLEIYVRTKRQSNAASQKQYLERRLVQVTDSLTAAEDKLKYFLLQNRAAGQAPDLTLDQSRLQRTIDLEQSVYVQLTAQMEQAKLDEIRDAPILNIEELAQDPIVKTGPLRARIMMAVMTASLLFSGLFFAFEDELKRFWKITLSHAEDYAAR